MIYVASSGAHAAKCIIPCSKIYLPICGKPINGNGPMKTFSNACMMETYNCENPNNSKDIFLLKRRSIDILFVSQLWIWFNKNLTLFCRIYFREKRCLLVVRGNQNLCNHFLSSNIIKWFRTIFSILVFLIRKTYLPTWNWNLRKT